MGYRRRLKYYLIKLCRLHDSPKSVAGGIAVGTVIHFYPTCGLGAVFTAALAGLFRANLVAATLAWALTMPLFPFFFYLNLLVGDQFVQPTRPNIYIAVKKMAHLGWRDVILLGKAFVIGSIINGVIALILIWWLGYLLLRRYRKSLLALIRRAL